MDWKQFISSVIASIAWPVAVVAILLIFKNKIGQVISQIRKFAAGSAGVSFELAEQVENVRSAGEAVEAEQSVQDVVALDPEILELAKNFPGAAFLQSFKQLENVILQIRSRLPDDKPHRNLNEVMQQLRIMEHISGSVVELFLQLRKARNAAAHGGEEDITSGEAVELIRQVRLLESLLKDVLSQLPKPRM